MATPEKIVFDGEIISLQVPGSAGYFEVLKDHTPIISSLTIGKITLTDADQKKTIWAMSGGIVEVFKNEAIVLGDSIELALEIDVARAEHTLKHAQKLMEYAADEEELLHAKLELKRAKNRLKIVQQVKSGRGE